MKKFIAVACCIVFCGLAVFAAEFISNNRSADSAVPSQSAESLPFSADVSKAVGNTSKQAVSRAEGESSAAEKAENKADTVRIVANGDSITFGHMPSTAGDGELIPNRGYEGMTNGVSFVTLACRNLDFELDNGAISCSTLSLEANGEDKHNALINRFALMPDDADLVFIAIGSNDWFYQLELGQMSDRDGTSFYGALHTLCGGLKKKYPDCPIVFSTPIKRWIYREDDSIPGKLNAHRQEISLYCNAIKQVCAAYGIDVIDMYNECGFDLWSQTDRDAFAPDGTHPNLDGHRKMAAVLEKRLKKYFEK